MKYSEHHQNLLQNGFSVFQNFLSESLISTLRKQRDTLLSDLSDAHRSQYRSQGSLVNFGEHPEFSHLIALPEFQKLMQGLGFDHSRWLAGYMISKPPKSPALFWHQDWWGWDHPMSYTSTIPGLGIMIYLTDTCVENGCLRVVPGSHRCQHPLHKLPLAHEQSLSHIQDPNNIAYRSDKSELAVEVSVGDVVLMDPRLLHSAYANQTETERSLITLWYLPDFEWLPGEIKARYTEIFNRHDLDTGDTHQGSLLDHWPEDERQRLQLLEPVYRGFEKPCQWNRRPDTSRMKTA